MSEVRLVLRDAERDLSGTIHGSVGDAAVAALSADPVTIEELNVALERFRATHGDRGFFAWFGPGINDEPYDAGLVVIDLAARLVVVDSTYSSPGHRGRRRERAARPEIDVRGIVYGRPLIEFLASGCFCDVARRDEIKVQVHEKWIQRRREWIERYADGPQPDPASLSLEELAPGTAAG